MHEFYNVQIFMENKTSFIPPTECLRTSDILETYNEVAIEVYSEYCLKEANWLANEYQKYNFIIVIFIIAVVITMLILIIFIVGFYKVMGNLFYVFSGHWILEWIIKMREGDSLNNQLDNNLTDLIENDEQIASAIIDTENDIEDEEEEPST